MVYDRLGVTQPRERARTEGRYRLTTRCSGVSARVRLSTLTRSERNHSVRAIARSEEQRPYLDHSHDTGRTQSLDYALPVEPSYTSMPTRSSLVEFSDTTNSSRSPHRREGHSTALERSSRTSVATPRVPRTLRPGAPLNSAIVAGLRLKRCVDSNLHDGNRPVDHDPRSCLDPEDAPPVQEG